MLTAMLTELGHFKTVFEFFLILLCVIVRLFTVSALHLNEIVL